MTMMMMMMCVREDSGLRKMNLSDTAVEDWAQVDRLRDIPGLTHLRMMGCPFNREMDPVARRQHDIARRGNCEIGNS